MPGPDKITLAGLEFYAYHGVLEGERLAGQKFEVDVEVYRDLAPAGTTDDLEQGLDYRLMYNAARESMDPPAQLLETVAERIAARLLALGGNRLVVVRVRKPGVALGGLSRYAEVEIRRGPAADCG